MEKLRVERGSLVERCSSVVDLLRGTDGENPTQRAVVMVPQGVIGDTVACRSGLIRRRRAADVACIVPNKIGVVRTGNRSRSRTEADALIEGVLQVEVQRKCVRVSVPFQRHIGDRKLSCVDLYAYVEEPFEYLQLESSVAEEIVRAPVAGANEPSIVNVQLTPVVE